MKELSSEAVSLINKKCLRDGEPFNILDMGRLESALGNQYNGHLYGSDLQAAVSTFKALVLNHPFANGNKRTALAVLLYLTKDSDEKLVLNHDEIIKLIYDIASEGGSQLSVNNLTNKLFGTSLEEAVEKHNTLNPLLWNEDHTLKPEVEDKINEIVDDFLQGLIDDGIKFILKDVKLVGSNCSYNYNPGSDLDIHLVMDTDSLECPDDLYPLLYSSYRSIYNKNHDIKFYGIPVEIFIETDDTVQMDDEEVDKSE